MASKYSTVYMTMMMMMQKKGRRRMDGAVRVCERDGRMKRIQEEKYEMVVKCVCRIHSPQSPSPFVS